MSNETDIPEVTEVELMDTDQPSTLAATAAAFALTAAAGAAVVLVVRKFTNRTPKTKALEDPNIEATSREV